MSEPSPKDAPELATDPAELLARLGEADEAARALLGRPRLSLRIQLLLGFLVVFLFAAGIAATIIISIYKLESRIKVLEIASDYVLEIEQARRYEKNHFLYNTGLADALEAVFRARQILQSNRAPLSRVMAPLQWREMISNIDAYERLLSQLAGPRSQPTSAPTASRQQELEPRVRKQGHKMILLAKELMKRERLFIEATIASSLRIQSYSLIFLLVFMISTAYLVSGNIVRSIVRFESYAQRIAAGDFTPITPARRYRDEFTDLGLAINHMMEALQKHEAMLVQAHKMRAIGTLTAGVAHELNNPLNNITITAHMLIEDYESLDDDERKDMVGDVAKEVDRAKKIVSNLLDFTRESETTLTPIDLPRLLQDTVALATNQLKIAGIRAELNAIDGLPQISGDQQQLQQVFLNLILNAVQASTRGSKIQILVQPADEPHNLSVKVIDHGKGIPSSILPRIFDPFFTTKDKGKGTGLGLSVSQGIIDKHGGRMLVDSREDHGTTFTVVLPTIEEKE